jgi:hypothetical protein
MPQFKHDEFAKDLLRTALNPPPNEIVHLLMTLSRQELIAAFNH